MEEYKKKLGWWGEELATKYLIKQGFKIIERRWKKREGEIDIIAFDSLYKCLVFVEVKTRTSNSFGQPEESIDQQKKKKLENIVSRYIVEVGYQGEYRFDIIIVRKDHKIIINHLKNVIFD